MSDGSFATPGSRLQKQKPRRRNPAKRTPGDDGSIFSRALMGDAASGGKSGDGYRLGEQVASAESGSTALLATAISNLHAEMREQRAEMRHQAAALSTIMRELADGRANGGGAPPTPAASADEALAA